MADIRIYGVTPSSFTRTVRLACHEKGIGYELVPTIPSQAGALNPFHKIPIITHGDLTLFETTAILRYLDRTFPGPKLWPEDSRAAAFCDQWISAFCDSMVNSALRFLAHQFGFLPVPQEMADKYLAKAREVIPVFDRQLGASRYLVGDRVTAADLFLAPLALFLPQVPGLKEIAEAAPNLARWSADMSARPSLAATVPDPIPAVAA